MIYDYRLRPFHAAHKGQMSPAETAAQLSVSIEQCDRRLRTLSGRRGHGGSRARLSWVPLGQCVLYLTHEQLIFRRPLC